MPHTINETMSKGFEQKIENAISRHDLLCRDGFYIVALSGGPDSVALLRVLVALGYHVHAAHCNFHLRGEESDRDEKFCESLCEKQGVQLHKIHFDTKTYATLHQVSVEMAARDLRYHYFASLCLDIHADGICVAHHSDDQVETILLNIIRGTGMSGLQGMKWRNGNILRPMLGVTRQEVLDYLDSLRQEFVVDHTNLEDEVQRNKVRLNIMPLLEDINPAVKDNILRMAGHVAEADMIIAHALDEQTKQVCVSELQHGLTLDIDLSQLSRQPSPEYLLWHLLNGYSFRRTQISEMLAAQTGGNKWFNNRWVAFIDRGHLCVTSREEWGRGLVEMRIPERGTYVARMGDEEKRLTLQLHEGWREPSRAAFVATLDADRVVFPLMLRQVQAGDRFMPFGLKGSKLVSDYLKDRKVPLLERRLQLVLADATGAIVWLVGRSIDNRASIRKETTCRVLTVKWK